MPFSPIALAGSSSSAHCFVNGLSRLCRNSGKSKLYLRYSFDLLAFASAHLKNKHETNTNQLLLTSLKSAKETLGKGVKYVKS